jgi:hypothetical protein
MSVNITIDTTELRRKIAASLPAIERDITRAVNSASKVMVDRAKQGEFKDQTGELRRSISYVAVGWQNRGYYNKVLAATPYALYVEEPTKPHWIYPKAGYNAPTSSLMPGQTRRGRGPGPHKSTVGGGHALRWVNASGEHFASRVYHPGTAGFHFMYRAGQWARIKLIQELHGNFTELRSVWNH